jgi:hypothetical protein|nr:MAG TPA: hypothetical protein [Caudoviricetes sp.]
MKSCTGAIRSKDEETDSRKAVIFMPEGISNTLFDDKLRGDTGVHN